MKENFELRLREIKKLKHGWHFGIGEPFNEDHVEIAIYLANKYYNLYHFSVSGMPNVCGDIELIFSHNDKFIDIFIKPSMKEFTAIYSEGIGVNRISEQWGVFELKKIEEVMKQFHSLITAE